MLNRLFASLGLSLAAFAAATGVASAAIETTSDVMYLTGATVVVFLLILSIVAAVKHALGLDKMAPPEAGEDFGHHGHGPASDHSAAEEHDDEVHGAPVSQSAHH